MTNVGLCNTIVCFLEFCSTPKRSICPRWTPV